MNCVKGTPTSAVILFTVIAGSLPVTGGCGKKGQAPTQPQNEVTSPGTEKQPGQTDAASAVQGTEAILPKIIVPGEVRLVAVNRGPIPVYFMVVGRVDVKMEDLVKHASPAKPEYAKWLIIKVDITLPAAIPNQWRLSRSECFLRSAADPSEEYSCLGIIDPTVKRLGTNILDPLPKESLRGEKRFSTTPYDDNTMTVQDMYDEIVLDSAKGGDELQLSLGFSQKAGAKGGEFLLMFPLLNEKTPATSQE